MAKTRVKATRPKKARRPKFDTSFNFGALALPSGGGGGKTGGKGGKAPKGGGSVQ